VPEGAADGRSPVRTTLNVHTASEGAGRAREP